ncbi:glycosyltransferase family 2 protein [Paenibacillus ginsengihumi]|uniref:glycosyltransferase family 2 protein n=1 Tax=Paenibacillus ginsengihumi TaxID=431596 RepID=UPI000369D639|nr:glycosyltransferase family 2 protein [Paenibacillus ginsengihumi]
MHSRIVVGLPAYNEEDSLGPLLNQLIGLRRRFGARLEIVVVNDGSTDRTADIVYAYCRAYPFVRYVEHERNRGLGAAVRTLLSYVVRHYDSADLLVTMDADNTHPPHLIPSLVAKMNEGRLDVAIASRFAPGGEVCGLSWRRRMYSRGAALFFTLFFPITHVRDYSSGFRCYRIGYLKRVSTQWGGELITGSGFECMAELLARFSRVGVRAGEVPLVLRYDLKTGPSKMHAARTIRGYFRLLGEMRALPKPPGTAR